MWERNHRRARAALAGLALALLLAPPANAHDGATGVVKERMQAMDAMAKSMKTVGPMIRGQVSLDHEKAAAAGRMEETAKDGADSTGMAAAFKGVGGVCADCHKEFRAKKR
jgi:cytochrome c556